MQTSKSTKRNDDRPVRGKTLDSSAYTAFVKSPLPDEFPNVDERIVKFCDDLMESCWQPVNVHPKRHTYGSYVIGRWFPSEKVWIILYCGHGYIRDRLGSNFNGKSPIGRYLSSFPKELRHLIMVKWLRDHYFPRPVVDFDQLLSVLAFRYNGGELPAFNTSVKDLTTKCESAEGFTLIPSYESKTIRTKKP